MELSAVLDALAAAVAERAAALVKPAPAPSPSAAPPSWRERLWVCDPATRLGVEELAEATGKPKSWVYAHTKKSCRCVPLPHRRLDGTLVFLAGELRPWLLAHERVVIAARTTPLVIERQKGRA